MGAALLAAVEFLLEELLKHFVDQDAFAKSAESLFGKLVTLVLSKAKPGTLAAMIAAEVKKILDAAAGSGSTMNVSTPATDPNSPIV